MAGRVHGLARQGIGCEAANGDGRGWSSSAVQKDEGEGRRRDEEMKMRTRD